MQGQRGAIGSFTETISFEHGSSSSSSTEANAIDPQIFWENNMQNSESSNPLSDYIALPDANNVYLNSTNQQSQMWNVSEPPPSMISLGDHGSSSFSPFPEASRNNINFKSSSSSSSPSFADPFASSSELDDRRLSRKRKAVELNSGQSSSQIPENDDDIIPRLGLRIGASSDTPVLENSHRNVQLRINSSSRQQIPSTNNNDDNNNRQSENLASYSSLRLNPVDLRSQSSTGTPENSSSQPVLRIPALRRNYQSTSRWNRNSTSRSHRSSNLVIPGDRNEVDSISDHPLFAPPTNARNPAQTEINWNSNPTGNTSSGPSPSSAPPNPAPHRSSSHNARRLSAFLRRSLLSADSDSVGGSNNHLFPRIPPSVSTSSSASENLGIPPSVSIQGHHHHHQPHSRSSVLLGRQLEGVFGIPHLSRSMTAGSEGRGRLVSEIRNVLDSMRRGEPLRIEDLMLLDQSVFYGIADIHDRHRDMRLDIDNMSYEELLALEERIGSVNTGLTEETISKHLKQKQYVAETGQPDPEPCCICQEEYNDGDDLGTLECGHDFHCGCIKKWLQQKNSCPICKSTGFKAT